MVKLKKLKHEYKTVFHCNIWIQQSEIIDGVNKNHSLFGLFLTILIAIFFSDSFDSIRIDSVWYSNVC